MTGKIIITVLSGSALLGIVALELATIIQSLSQNSI